MNRTFLILSALILSLGLAACGGKQNAGGPPDYIPIVTSSLSSGAAIAEIFAAQAVAAEDWRACVAAEVVSEAAQSAASALVNFGDEIPAIDIDVSGCLTFNPDFTPGDQDEGLSMIITTLTESILDTVQLIIERETDKPEQCDSVAFATGALDYVSNAAGPIVDEIVAPDGVISLAAVVFDFSGCEFEGE